MVLKVISGGQSGADIAGLVAAKRCGLETGGFSANGFETETGKRPEYAKLYNLVDKHYNYAQRTVENVKASDATIVFAGNISSSGTRLTLNTCIKFGKKYLVNPTVEEIVDFINQNNPHVLNIAGNRESVNPGITSRVEKMLTDAFRRL
jgi:hypothetical protein